MENQGRQSRRHIDIDGSPLVRLTLSHDGELLAASARDGQVTIWQTRTQNILATYALGSPAVALDFAPDDAALLACLGNQTATILRTKAPAVATRPASEPASRPGGPLAH